MVLLAPAYPFSKDRTEDRTALKIARAGAILSDTVRVRCRRGLKTAAAGLSIMFYLLAGCGLAIVSRHSPRPSATMVRERRHTP